MERRRLFLTTYLPAGLALAARPAAAAIVTDTRGLIAREVSIPSRDGESIPGYAARPARLNGYPILLVVEEIFGVNEYIRDVCRRLAKLGYFAIAPDLFHRHGDPSGIGDARRIISGIVSKTPDREAMEDLDSALEWAIAEKGSKTKIAITGFSWGGRITWLYAAWQPKVKAAAAWYGVLSRPPRPARAPAGSTRRHRRLAEDSRSRTLWRPGPRHPSGHRRGNDRGAGKRDQQI